MTRLSNQDVAKLFTHIGDLTEIRGDNRFKVLAYRKAADNIAELGQDVYDLWQAGQLKQVPGIGKAISEKIDELFASGRLTFWEKLTADLPPSLVDVLAIPDVGPKLVKQMWEGLGLATVADVKAAAEAGRLRTLPRMGEKKEARILASIGALERRRTDRYDLFEAQSLTEAILNILRDLPQLIHIEPAGSFRRGKETIGDLDFVVATEDPTPIMTAFQEMPQAVATIAHGPTKSSMRFRNGLQADLRCVQPQHWGAALQYFTGSQNHNVRVREIAQQQGYSLNEYSLTREADGEEIYFETEMALYEQLGLAYIPPHLREDRGEIDAAQQGKLPAGLTINDIQGEVHCHSTWSDGKFSIEAMVQAAIQRGYSYLAITDHSYSLGIANGLSVERLRAQRDEIEIVRQKYSNFQLWHGTEMEIKADGSLDFSDEVLAELDFVIGAVHTGLRQDRDALTRRMLNAIHNPHVHLIAHPTGRLINRREGGDFDLEAIYQAAAQTGTLLEINANPSRLDLRDSHVRRARQVGVTLVINCDAHHVDEFSHLHFGVQTACRGWASTADIANTWSAEEFAARVMSREGAV